MDAPPDSTLIHFAIDDASSDEDPMELPDVLPRIIAADEYDGGDILMAGVMNVLEKTPRVTITNFIEQVVPRYTDFKFVEIFRLKRGTVLYLVERFESSEEYQSLGGHGGFEPISAEKHILTFLFFVAREAHSYRDLADRFDLSLAAVHSIITRVTNFLLHIAPNVIRYPTDEEKQHTKDHFMLYKNFSGIIGVIDGSHVRINAPLRDKDAYINRKKYFSIQMQAVVNESMRFLDVFVGYPGSVHDARVFSNSYVREDLPTLCQRGDFLLGDSAYPCLPQLVTPYRDNGHMTRAQRKYNYIHSSCRTIVEHAFGRLKQRFRILYHMKLQEMRRMVKVIHACCVLHNIADMEDIDFFEAPEEDEHPDPQALEIIRGIRVAIDEEGDPNDSQAGREFRDELCRQLTQIQ